MSLSMQTGETPQFTIVGAGLAGALLACYLGKAGWRVDLYEKRADPRQGLQEGGRSINLALSVRGIEALRPLGLAELVLREAVPMRGRMMHDRRGRLAFQPYGKDESECLHSVGRADLNRTLVDAAARQESVRLFFERKCVGLDLHSMTLHLQTAAARPDPSRDPTVEPVPAAVVIGADGAYSAVRAALQRLDRFDFSQEYLTHGYKELTIPPAPDGKFQMEPNALHIWPRRTFMMIALPNRDGSFTCTLFWPFEGPNSFAALTAAADVRRFFQEQFPDAVPLLPDLADQFLANPTGSLVTIRCRPWHHEGRAVLLGDACHAVVPFLGQGMNAAFEDCLVLNECLTELQPDWQAAFRRYESRRKVHLDVLADLCLANFIEMRDKVGTRRFRFRKKLDVLLHRLFPRWYQPLYTLIEFTRIPYAEALARARRQETALRTAVAALLGLLVILLAWLLVGPW
jgi:kynurenine 3-monooxygenase